MKSPFVNALAIFMFLSMAWAVTARDRTVTRDLSGIADGKGWKLAGRKAVALAAEGRKGIRFDSQPGQGVAWLQDLEFSEGTIELDLKGEDKPQQSFVGIAFRVVDEKTHDAVYFRPFNFKNADPA